MFKDFDPIILKTDVPGTPLKAGMLGVILLNYPNSDWYEVEFMNSASTFLEETFTLPGDTLILDTGQKPPDQPPIRPTPPRPSPPPSASPPPPPQPKSGSAGWFILGGAFFIIAVIFVMQQVASVDHTPTSPASASVPRGGPRDPLPATSKDYRISESDSNAKKILGRWISESALALEPEFFADGSKRELHESNGGGINGIPGRYEFLDESHVQMDGNVVNIVFSDTSHMTWTFPDGIRAPFRLRYRRSQHMTTAAAEASQPQDANNVKIFIKITAAAEAQVENWQVYTIEAVQGAHYTKIIVGQVFSGSDFITRLPASDSRSALYIGPMDSTQAADANL
jgi:hypothetical protein